MPCYQEHNKCRICWGANIISVLDFGETALANAFLEENDLNKEEIFAPLEVFLCQNCGSVQLKHTVHPDILFDKYLYESSTSKSFQRHFEQYAKTIFNRFHLTNKDTICDIGSNDGILLKPFQKLGCKVLGIEPAARIATFANESGLPTLNCYFNNNTADKIFDQYGLCKIITANNVFAHIDNLHEIIETTKELLTYDGVFVFENAYLLDTINNLYFDQVYSEHIYYHSIKPLIYLFNQHDMDIFDVEQNDIQGGTIRVFAQRKDGCHELKTSHLEFLLERESDLYTPIAYLRFSDKLAEIKNTLHEMLTKHKNKTICAYGAPAKFTTFCKVMGLDKDIIQFVVDDAPSKQGRYSPGTHIPVVSSSWLHDKNPDLCIVTAWNFARHIIANNPLYKGKWVIPLPNIEEITK